MQPVDVSVQTFGQQRPYGMDWLSMPRIPLVMTPWGVLFLPPEEMP